MQWNTAGFYDCAILWCLLYVKDFHWTLSSYWETIDNSFPTISYRVLLLCVILSDFLDCSTVCFLVFNQDFPALDQLLSSLRAHIDTWFTPIFQRLAEFTVAFPLLFLPERCDFCLPYRQFFINNCWFSVGYYWCVTLCSGGLLLFSTKLRPIVQPLCTVFPHVHEWFAPAFCPYCSD